MKRSIVGLAILSVLLLGFAQVGLAQSLISSGNYLTIRHNGVAVTSPDCTLYINPAWGKDGILYDGMQRVHYQVVWSGSVSNVMSVQIGSKLNLGGKFKQKDWSDQINNATETLQCTHKTDTGKDFYCSGE